MNIFQANVSLNFVCIDKLILTVNLKILITNSCDIYKLTMQDNGMFEATFNSSVEFDIKLKQKNGEIYVSSGGNHKIPGLFENFEINFA